ncbi:MAG: reverse transcriptase family protein, partial [Candidatus Thiodiazotropha sp.]
MKNSLNDISSLNINILAVLLLLILLSGDVSENPGPDLDQSNQSDNLSILHLNIRSIRNKLEFVKDSLSDFDILCFSETHLTDNISNNDIHIEGFQPISFRKDVSAHSSGLLIYVTESLLAVRLSDLEANLEESLWIEIKHKGESYILCNIYRPPNTPVDFWRRFNITIERALEMSKQIIVVGDLNEDLLNPRNHNLKDIIMLNNLINVINVPTRVTNTSQTLLDPIILSETIKVLDSGILSVPADISDHSATYVLLPFTYNHFTAFKRVVWQYKKGDFCKFNRLISSTDWEFLKDDSIDNACDNFTSKFINLAKECIPCKEVTIRPNDKPWYDSEIRTFSRKRDRLRKKAAKSGSNQDWQNYKKLRNKVNNLKSHAKEQFYSNIESTIIEAKNTNPKQYWKLVKYFIKSNKGAEIIPPLKTASEFGDEIYSFTDLEKANTLNEYFESISNINEGNTELPNLVLKTANTLDSIYIEESEIKDVIRILEVNKACGQDLVSHTMLKMTCDTVVKPLHILINRSLSECTFPTLWKKAIVMPLFKKGSPDTPSNYRPISLISTVGKLMERVVYKHLYNFFHSNNLIYKLQSGFLPGHSTVFQLIDIYNQICQSFDSKQYTCMVFCDISKAFDRVWHKGLLFKLEQNGIKGGLLKWISHYLSGRSQRVFVGSS